MPRHQSHLGVNQERQLLAKENATEQNRRKKLEQAQLLTVTVAVFRVRDLSTPQWRFKLNINAKQNHLTGCVLLYENINVVIVEGAAARYQAVQASAA